MPAIILAKTYDNNVPDSPGKWYKGQLVTAVPADHVFSVAELPSGGNFYHITIIDKTVEEVQEYLQGWSHNPTTSQVSAVGDTRLLEVVSDMVSVSGKNAFTQAGIDAFIADLNADYPTANATFDSRTDSSFRFNVTIPLAGRDELIERVNEAVRNMQYARRIWGLTQAGYDYLDANGNQVSGTAAQVAGYLRNGLLD